MSKLDGIKAGDRVRVTFEGKVTYDRCSDGLRVATEGDVLWVGASLNKSEDHFQINRIDRPLAVGDKVVSTLRAGPLIDDERPLTLIAFLSDGRAVCEYEAGETTGVVARNISCLRHA